MLLTLYIGRTLRTRCITHPTGDVKWCSVREPLSSPRHQRGSVGCEFAWTVYDWVICSRDSRLTLVTGTKTWLMARDGIAAGGRASGVLRCVAAPPTPHPPPPQPPLLSKTRPRLWGVSLWKRWFWFCAAADKLEISGVFVPSRICRGWFQHAVTSKTWCVWLGKIFRRIGYTVANR